MKVLKFPFTHKLNIRTSSRTPYLLELPYSEKILNHLSTIHGSASYALAEISSGSFLNTRFADIADQTIPILRESRVKYKIAGQSSLYSKVQLKDMSEEDVLIQLKFKRKILITLLVKLYNEDQKLVLSAEFDWFITLPK